jgi:CRP-like cAMP-binding protein
VDPRARVCATLIQAAGAMSQSDAENIAAAEPAVSAPGASGVQLSAAAIPRPPGVQLAAASIPGSTQRDNEAASGAESGSPEEEAFLRAANDTQSSVGAGAPGSLRKVIRRTHARRVSVEAINQVQGDVTSLYGRRPSVAMVDLVNPKARKCQLHPDSKFRLFWDMGQAGTLLYLAVTVPLRMCFDIQVDIDNPVFWLESCIDLMFIVDIVLNFTTAIHTDDSELITEPKKIALHYMARWFIIDLVSSIPFTYIVLIANNGEFNASNNVKGFKIIRLMRLTKLLRLRRLLPLLKKLDDMFDSVSFATTGAKLVGMGFMLLYFSHVLCCLWFYIGNTDDFVGTTHEIQVDGWVSAEFFAPVSSLPNVTRASWRATEEVGVWRLWLRSFYWSITTLTTVGYGDISANTEAEMMFSIVAELMGCVIFSVVMGTIGVLVSKGEVLKGVHETEMTALKEFMAAKHIPTELQTRVRKYMEHHFLTKRGFDERTVLAKMAPALRFELLEKLYRDQLANVPLFRSLSEEAFNEVCFSFKPAHYAKDCVIYRERDYAREMYVCVNGRVLITSGEERLSVFEPGSLFGEAEALLAMLGDDGDPRTWEPIRRSTTATAVEDQTEIVVLGVADLAKLSAHYPTLSKTILDFTKQRHKKYGMQVSNGEFSMKGKPAAFGGMRTMTKNLSEYASDGELSTVAMERIVDDVPESVVATGKTGVATSDELEELRIRQNSMGARQEEMCQALARIEAALAKLC